MKCTQCGAQVDGDFCPYCGAKPESKTVETPVEQPQAAPVKVTNKTDSKENKIKKPLYKKWWFWVIVVIIVANIFNRLGGNDRVEEFVWSDMELHEVLPEPESNVGEIISNSDTSLSIYIHKTTESDYKEYLAACEKLGFTVEKDKSEHNYSAFNNEGYKLTLWYNDSDEELHIGLDVPMEMGELHWPNSEIGKKLPTPASTVGHIEWEADYGFVINVGNTPKADYDKYVNACMDKGFNVDYNKGDDYFQADNAEGYHISLRYDGNNIMWIRADEPDADAASAEDEKNDEEAETSKEATKDYITDFVEKYNAAADTPITDRVRFDPKDRESGHYRTEYRLTAWDGSIGEAAKIGNADIDMVNYGSYGGYYENNSFRVYVSADTVDEIISMFPTIAKIMDPTVTDEDIQDVIDHVKEYGDKNGIVMGNLSGYILSHQHYAELMLD